MKTNMMISALIVSSIVSLDGLALEKSQANTASQKMSLLTQDNIEIGLQNYWYQYEEKVDGAFFMSNTGYKYGITFDGTKKIGDNYYITGDIRYATADVKYKSSSGTGYVSDNVAEGRLILGNEAIVTNYLLSSYIGVGYRHLDNDLRSLGRGGYRRTSQYLYVPIGITHRFLVDNSSRITSSLEYDYFAWGEQKSYLSDVGPANAAVFGDPVNKQKKGFGVRANTAYELKNWSFGAFLNYWRIQDSEINYYRDGVVLYGLMEPRNETKEVGIQIKYRF